MSTLHKALSLILLVLILALPAYAQESPELAIASIAIPPMLATLILVNNRATEFVKLWLASPTLPINLTKETQSVIVLSTSFIVGLAASIFIPNATSWLPEDFQRNVIAAILLSTFASSFGGAMAQYVLMVLYGASQWFAAAKSTIYSTTTSISTPPIDTPPAAAKDAMQAVSQAVKADK